MCQYQQDTKPPTRLLYWIQTLTQPHVSLTDDGEISQVRLLAGLMLITMLISATALLLRSTNGAGNTLTHTATAGLVVSIVIYGLSRTRHHRLSLYLIMAGGYITTAIILPLLVDPVYAITVITPIFIVSFMVHPLATLAFATLCILTQIMLLFGSSGEWSEFAFPIIFSALTSAIIITAAIILQYNRHLLKLRQDAVLSNEARFRSLAENSPDFILILKMPEYKIEYTNRAHFLGNMLDSRFISGNFLQKLHADDQDAVRNYHSALSSGELTRQSEIEFRVPADDRKWEWVHSRQTVIDKNPDGKPARVLIVLTLITAQKNAQEKLQASEMRYRAIADNVTDMISRHDVETGDYTYVSPACRQLLGYDFQELLGRNPYELFHPDDIPAIQASHEFIKAQPDYYTVTYRIQHKDGHFVWFETASRTIRDPDTDEPVEIICVSRDVTERQQQQDELARSEARFRHLFNKAPESIVLHDVEGNIHDVNEKTCEMLGYARDELLQLTIPDINISWTREKVVELLSDYEDRLPMTQEGIRKRRDGSTFPVEIRADWFDLDSQRLILSYVRDITERKRAERQQAELIGERERVQALQKFIDDVSHDLMTPITTLNTGLYLLERMMTTEQQHSRLKKLEVQVSHLTKVIEDMLTMSRLDRPVEMMFEFEPDDLNAVIQQCVDRMRPAAVGKGHTLRLDLRPALPAARLDAERLDRALEEVLDNAINYTPDGGTITVKTMVADDKTLVIEVQDTGTGIAEGTLPHIFELLYRGDEHRPMNGGTGLGLPIAQRIVEAHGGTITVESTVGIGSCFRLTVPRSACEV